MTDRQTEPREAAAEAAEPGSGLLAWRHQHGRDWPYWQADTDLEPIPEADMF